tara:strand:+ start:8882 stop:9727 length:846 start_codon:yes stop_codon:yes gene_type:complete
MLGASGGLVLFACGNDETAATVPVEPTGGLSLGARFADGFQAPSVITAGTPQRAPYVLIGSDGWPAVNVPDQIELTVTSGDQVVFTGTVNRHGEPNAIPYFPLVFTPPVTGDYSVRGAGLPGRHRLRVTNTERLDLIQVGDQMRPVESPTLKDPNGVNPICTRPDGPCPLHEVTVSEAINRPGPTALLISTPRFCQTDVCGPALEVVIEAAGALDSSWSVIHAEVYKGPEDNDFGLTQTVTAYDLSFEPSLVVADANGIVTAILHFTMDTSEVDAALASAT